MTIKRPDPTPEITFSDKEMERYGSFIRNSYRPFAFGVIDYLEGHRKHEKLVGFPVAYQAGLNCGLVRRIRGEA